MFSAEEYVDRSIAKVKQNDLPGAIADLDKAIKLKPDLAEAWSIYGVTKQLQGDLLGAIADLDKAIKLKPDLAGAWNNRGGVKQLQGDLPGAIADYDEAIKFKPGLAGAWNNRGIAKAKQGDLPGAIADHDEAINIKPDLAGAWLSRGNAKRAQGDLPGAIADYDKAIKFKLDFAEAWISRGDVKRVQGDLPGAIADYDKAIKFKPDFAEAWLSRGDVKQVQGDLPGAIVDLGEAIKLKPDLAEAWFSRGMVKYGQGDLPDAIADYGEAIKLNPDLAEAWNNRGVAKENQRDLPGAIADYGEAIKLKPNFAEVWSNRGLAKEKQGNLQDAIADYDKAIKLKPDLERTWINRFVISCVVRNAVREKVEPKEIWDIFNKARSAIEALHKALEDKANDKSEHPMHYTSLDTLRNLAKGGKFRLYNVKSVDDGEEGKALFDLFDKEHQEKIRKIFSATRSEDLEVFIGSFVSGSSIGYGDDLMWKTYGKHKEEERAGCALVFDKEQHFAARSLPLTRLLEARSEGFTDKEQDEIVKQKECYLYPVCYNPQEIQGEVDNLCKALVQLCDEKYKETREMVAVLLNHVRYLFKHEYQRNKEYRLTIMRVSKSPAIKEELPRTYVECSLDMKKVAVLLGPKVKEAETWKQRLEDKKIFKEIKTANRSS